MRARRGLSVRSTYRRTLGALASLAAIAYLNFFSFHGERTFVHYHDVAHYYLGSKYFRELGYANLYTAMLRAEAESSATASRRSRRATCAAASSCTSGCCSRRAPR